MDYFTANQRMSLEDARIILQFELVRGWLQGCNIFADYYDSEMQYREHEYYDHAVNTCNEYAFDADMTDHDRYLDARYVQEQGCWKAALHVVNRALPATDQHAFLCDDWFLHEVRKGFWEAAVRDGHSPCEATAMWCRSLVTDTTTDDALEAEQLAYIDDFVAAKKATAQPLPDSASSATRDDWYQLELPFDLHKWVDWAEAAYTTDVDHFNEGWLVGQRAIDSGLRNLADYILALVLYQCGWGDHGLTDTRQQVADDPVFQQRFRYWCMLDHDEVIYAMGEVGPDPATCTSCGNDAFDVYDACTKCGAYYSS